MKTLKQRIDDYQFETEDVNAIIKEVKEWLTQKRQEKVIVYGQDAECIFDELLEELEE